MSVAELFREWQEYMNMATSAAVEAHRYRAGEDGRFTLWFYIHTVWSAAAAEPHVEAHAEYATELERWGCRCLPWRFEKIPRVVVA